MAKAPCLSRFFRIGIYPEAVFRGKGRRGTPCAASAGNHTCIEPVPRTGIRARTRPRRTAGYRAARARRASRQARHRTPPARRVLPRLRGGRSVTRPARSPWKRTWMVPIGAEDAPRRRESIRERTADRWAKRGRCATRSRRSSASPADQRLRDVPCPIARHRLPGGGAPGVGPRKAVQAGARRGRRPTAVTAMAASLRTYRPRSAAGPWCRPRPETARCSRSDSGGRHQWRIPAA